MKLRNIFFLSVLTLSMTAQAEQIIERSDGEACVIPDRVPIDGAEYSKGDLKRENKLCTYDFKVESSSEDAVAVALCPKLFSTYPAVELIQIPEGSTKADYEGKKCNKKVGAKNEEKKMAKYKNSMSCAKTPSIIGYYHISRALGIDSIPVTVLRTMKRETHLEVAENGAEYAKANPGELVSKNWNTLKKMLQTKDSAIMTEDKEYSIGGLSENPRGEQKYYEDFYPGATGLDGVKKFKGVKAFNNLSNSKPVSSFVGTDLTDANYQLIQKMKDASELIIMDTLFGQQDRFGNIHSYHTFLTNDGKELKKYTYSDIKDMIKKDGTDAEKKEVDKIGEMPAQWQKEVTARNKRIVALSSGYLKRKGLSFAYAQEMLIKDNDCGLKTSNVFKSLGMIDNVKHLNRKTYEQFVKLYEKVSSGAMDEYLATTLYMNDTEMSEFKTGLNYVADKLISKCKAGTLHLDLNVKAHFNGTNTNTACTSSGGAGTVPAPGKVTPAPAVSSKKIVSRAGVNIRTAVLESESSPTDASKLVIGGVAQMTVIGDEVEALSTLVVGKTTFVKVKVLKSSTIPVGSVVYIWNQALK